jgi:Flp pilus assembly protein CpaB
MRKKIILTFIVSVAIMTSCVSTAKFPVSNVVPAAEITAKTKKQGKPNYLVIITANNLSASDRLNPSKKIYVIWAVSDAGIIRNVGHFIQKNAIKSIYKASFPYQPVEIFITAEDEEGICQPEGIEISRTKL